MNHIFRNFKSAFIIIICICASTFLCHAADTMNFDKYYLLPKPQSAVLTGEIPRPASVNINMPYWEEKYREIFEKDGIKVDKNSNFNVKGIIVDEIPGMPTDNEEAYSLNICENAIRVEATSAKGIYWALMTLVQLMDSDCATLPLCFISDWPAFSYRGFMMDAGRSYISWDELKREIEVMSSFKMNVFHWHLTENQAWRLESKLFPELTDSASMIRDVGKFYTVEDCREIEQWAVNHNVEIIPEIDMPGHSDAFRRAFGFDMQTDEGINVLKQVISEACATFKHSRYFHIGTDEVKITNPDFVDEMVAHVRKHGKKAISWNPGWTYKPGEIDMTQLWSSSGKPTPGIPAVDSRLHYINHFDVYADIRALYRSRIYDKMNQDDEIVGAEIAVWNDRYVDNERDLIIQNNLYPLLLAIAERSWRGGGSEYFDGLGTNMASADSEDFTEFADFENRLLHYKNTTLSDCPIAYVKQTDVNWLITDQFPNEGNLDKIFPPEIEGIKSKYFYEGKEYGTREAAGAGIYLRHVWGDKVPSFYDNPMKNHTAYAFTQVYSPAEQTVGLQFETQNYSRSESDLPPSQGTWDYRGSKLWINGVEVEPPQWRNSHIERDNETSLGNENMAVRAPIPVELKEGWNQVMIKLPVGVFRTPETRLVKWMFTFVLTTPDGRSAAPGLIYSPSGFRP